MKQGDELPTPEEQRKRVERELAEIERSAAFVRSPVMRRLLRFIVRESEAGRGPLIKSYTVAVDGLGRSEDFDAQQDSYPRVQIGRLRKALESYYRQHQTATGLRFDLRPGSYEIHFVEADSPVGAKTGRGEWVASVRRKLAGVRTCHAAGTLVIIPALAVIAVIAIGAAQGWLSPWGREKAAVVHELRDFPLLDIQPISAQPGSNDGSTANFLTFQMTDAIRRSGWVRVRSTPAAGQRPPRPDPADYQLGGRLYRTGAGFTLLVELIDRDENLIVWTRSFPLALLPDGRIAHLDAMLAGLVRSIINPGGIIAERVLQESPRISLMAGYPCLLHAAEFKMQRSAETYRRVRTCLAETLASKPRLARAWALTAELEQDNVDFNYAGAAKSDSGRALAMANHAVVLGPDDAAARHILTLLQYRAGDYSRAVANGLQSYELNPYSSDLISRVGNILFFIGDSRGLDLTRRALELDPDLAPWFQQSLFFDAVAKGRAADAVAAIGAMSDLRGQGRIYMIALRAIAAAMEGKPATARHYWSIVTHAMPQAATDPQQVFTRMGVSVSYADRGVAILRSAGVFDRSHARGT